ncbi:hypothetical protein [Paraburkholderia caledonica]|jgi:hypothetical protein|uniref:hypothetical protein n=2 Tax=Paraburkholderia TaxID=1822464 RepID=UPI0014704971|nr:hypothetical protein [Paraburkholderia caledonica]
MNGSPHRVVADHVLRLKKKRTSGNVRRDKRRTGMEERSFMPQKEQTQSPAMARESDSTRTVVKSVHSIADPVVRINPSMMNTHAARREQSGEALLVLRCIG